MKKKYRVGILGGTGYVGQRLAALLHDHPYFDINVIAASERSAGKSYHDAVKDRWKLSGSIPERLKEMTVLDLHNIDEISSRSDLVFCAVDMPAKEIRTIEETYAKSEIPVISNNSAHRMTPDVPVIIPEVNPEHLDIIEKQKKRLGTKRGFIVAKPNCSIQSYVPAINALMDFKPSMISVCTYQAISGSGKNFNDWPEMIDNVIPFIPGEEEKSEQEPLKVWGHVSGDEIAKAYEPVITAQCIRVSALEGHLAAVSVSFKHKPAIGTIIERWNNYKGKPQILKLPSAPNQFLTYFSDDNRPQTKLDRDAENGMGITLGRLREDNIFDYKFVCLSHNTLRGAAGGSVLTAELLAAEGYFGPR